MAASYFAQTVKLHVESVVVVAVRQWLQQEDERVYVYYTHSPNFSCNTYYDGDPTTPASAATALALANNTLFVEGAGESVSLAGSVNVSSE